MNTCRSDFSTAEGSLRVSLVNDMCVCVHVYGGRSVAGSRASTCSLHQVCPQSQISSTCALVISRQPLLYTLAHLSPCHVKSSLLHCFPIPYKWRSENILLKAKQRTSSLCLWFSFEARLSCPPYTQLLVPGFSLILPESRTTSASPVPPQHPWTMLTPHRYFAFNSCHF